VKILKDSAPNIKVRPPEIIIPPVALLFIVTLILLFSAEAMNQLANIMFRGDIRMGLGDALTMVTVKQFTHSAKI
jgi:hypothetical protein